MCLHTNKEKIKKVINSNSMLPTYSDFFSVPALNMDREDGFILIYFIGMNMAGPRGKPQILSWGTCTSQALFPLLSGVKNSWAFGVRKVHFLVQFRCVWGKQSFLHSLFKKEAAMTPSNKTEQCFLTYKQLRNSLGKLIAFWFLEQSGWWYLLCQINTSSTLQRETWNNMLHKAAFNPFAISSCLTWLRN